MRIIKTYNWSRRDFTFDSECEHCGHTETDQSGYDDRHFHDHVMPSRQCSECGKTSPEGSEPRATRYPEGMLV